MKTVRLFVARRSPIAAGPVTRGGTILPAHG